MIKYFRMIPDPEITGEYFSAEYSVENKTIKSTVVRSGYSAINRKVVDTIRLFGAVNVTSVIVNGNSHTAFEQLGEEVRITSLLLPIISDFQISFA